MCGRKTLTKNIASIIQELHIDDWLYPDFIPSYNIAPSQFSPVVIGKNDCRVVKKMQWGFENDWKNKKVYSPIINARSETLLETSSFNRLIHSNRCIIIADGYFEWANNSRQPHYIYHPHKQILPMAGLYRTFSNSLDKNVGSYTIITTSAQEGISKVHHRMPLILQKENINKWIFNKNDDYLDITKYLTTYTPNLNCHTVSTLVNSPTNNNPDCIKKSNEQQLSMNF